MKAPFSRPNSSLSISVDGIAAQLTRTIGRAAARAQLVDPRREQFLAGAGLAEQQHGRVGGRHLLDLLQHPRIAALSPTMAPVPAEQTRRAAAERFRRSGLPALRPTLNRLYASLRAASRSSKASQLHSDAHAIPVDVGGKKLPRLHPVRCCSDTRGRVVMVCGVN